MMNKPTEYISLDQCEKGAIYQIASRNLSFGIYDGSEGFIGVREKFYGRSLFTEYHYDQGPPYGTVHPFKKVGRALADIELADSFLTCLTCDVRAKQDHDREHDVRYLANKPLFRLLDGYESKRAEKSLLDGTMWLGKPEHSYQLMDFDAFQAQMYGEGEAPPYVTQSEYFDAQRKAGICIGIHHFAGENGICGRISTRRR